ncbi:hypothetical protein EJ02DRAFT_240936 [Clathrospora elynae]|uniref:Uncharacterized protein n=1 Tax=Clathrospora elynae TaxID=706981 RepID=A0A6A5SH85_9PLEO|nr:hypothetical protein EJ02DRAFT_240936 [Clathrospora elynae]
MSLNDAASSLGAWRFFLFRRYRKAVDDILACRQPPCIFKLPTVVPSISPSTRTPQTGCLLQQGSPQATTRTPECIRKWIGLPLLGLRRTTRRHLRARLSTAVTECEKQASPPRKQQDAARQDDVTDRCCAPSLPVPRPSCVRNPRCASSPQWPPVPRHHDDCARQPPLGPPPSLLDTVSSLHTRSYRSLTPDA